MRSSSGQPIPRLPSPSEALPQLRLLPELEPRGRAFVSSLAVLLPRRPRLTIVHLDSAPAPFWPDVFVPPVRPWLGLLQSIASHFCAAVVVWGLMQLQAYQPQQVLRSRFDESQVIYYQHSDYLPPLRSPATPPHVNRAEKADLAYAPQEIISIRPEVDNRSQTIITPPDVKLGSDVRLPNLVAWTSEPLPAAAATPGLSPTRSAAPNLPFAVVSAPPEFSRDVAGRQPPNSQISVVAPPPEFGARLERSHLQLPPEAVVLPPSKTTVDRGLGEFRVTQTQAEVTAPPPETHALPYSRSSRIVVAGTMGIAPPPDTHGIAGSRLGAQLLALNLSPVAPTGRINLPSGKRSGIFAAGPSGHAGGLGTPAATGEAGNGTGDGNGTGPAGITVGSAPVSVPAAAAVVAKTIVPLSTMSLRAMMASAIRPRRLAAPSNLPSAPSATPEEAHVFGMRKFYSMILNMPNLNSVSGSWIIRFAELDQNGAGGDLIAPVATEKVDPAYPADLMRARAEGTVTLYAVIRTDGTVADVRVLHSLDERLDEYARSALLRCHFVPATKNGSAVALEAVVRIPFQARRRSF